MQAALVALIAYLLALGITPLIQKTGLRYKWTDIPDTRKLHHQPIVRVGGVAIAISIAITMTLAFFIFGQSPSVDFLSDRQTLFLDVGQKMPFFGLLVGGLGFFFVGFLDDLFSLSPFHRLALQSLIGTFSWYLGVRMDVLPLPGLGSVTLGVLSLPVTLVWLAGVANAINWLDGLDGLASSIVVVTELVIFSLLVMTEQSEAIAFLCLTIVGSTLGFFYHNTHPAKIFMGDGGSYLLGFMLGGTSLFVKAAVPGFTTAIIPFVLLALPILDMSRVIIQRLWARRSPFYPDRGHLHHWLIDQGFSQRETVTLITGLSLWLSSGAFALVRLSNGPLLLLASTLFMLLQWGGLLRLGFQSALRWSYREMLLLRKNRKLQSETI